MRLSTNIMIAIVILNLVPSVLAGAGVWQDWGVQVDTGVNQAVENAQDKFEQTGQAGGFGGQTLIGAVLFAQSVLNVGFSVLTALPTLLSNLGVPYLGLFVNALVPIIIGRDLVSITSGREI